MNLPNHEMYVTFGGITIWEGRPIYGSQAYGFNTFLDEQKCGVLDEEDIIFCMSGRDMSNYQGLSGRRRSDESRREAW